MKKILLAVLLVAASCNPNVAASQDMVPAFGGETSTTRQGCSDFSYHELNPLLVSGTCFTYNVAGVPTLYVDTPGKTGPAATRCQLLRVYCGPNPSWNNRCYRYNVASRDCALLGAAQSVNVRWNDAQPEAPTVGERTEGPAVPRRFAQSTTTVNFDFVVVE